MIIIVIIIEIIITSYHITLQLHVLYKSMEYNNKAAFIKKISLNKYNHHSPAITMFTSLLSESDCVKNLAIINNIKAGLIEMCIKDTTIIIEHCLCKKTACLCKIRLNNCAGSQSIFIRLQNKLNIRGINYLISVNNLSGKVKPCKSHLKETVFIIEYINHLYTNKIRDKLLQVIQYFFKKSITYHELALICKELNPSKIGIMSDETLFINIFKILTVNFEPDNTISLIYAPNGFILKRINCYTDANLLNKHDIKALFRRNITNEDKCFLDTIKLNKIFCRNTCADADRSLIMNNILHNTYNIGKYCRTGGHNLRLLATCLKMFKNNIINVLKSQGAALTAYLCHLRTFDYYKTTYWFTVKNVIFIKAAENRFTLTFCSDIKCSCKIEVQYITGRRVICNAGYNTEKDITYFNSSGIQDFYNIYYKHRHSNNNNNKLCKNIDILPQNDEEDDEKEEDCGIIDLYTLNCYNKPPAEPIIIPMVFEFYSSINEENTVFQSLDSILFNSKLSEIGFK